MSIFGNMFESVAQPASRQVIPFRPKTKLTRRQHLIRVHHHKRIINKKKRLKDVKLSEAEKRMAFGDGVNRMRTVCFDPSLHKPRSQR